MFYRLFVLAALLPRCSGASSVEDPVKHVRAFAGDAVLLPCSFNIPASSKFQTVEWSKRGPPPIVVFVHRGGHEIHAEKHLDFLNRTSIVPKELKNGNFSLRISNVRLADAGTYRCMRLWMDGPRNVTSVELVVAAVSKPKLWVTSAEGGNVTLRCEASCWLPEPHINFLDKQGKYIQAQGPKRDEEARGCFTVTRRVTLKAAAANRVTCRVHQPETNQTRETEIIIPVDGGRSCFLMSAIAVGVTVLVLLAPLCGVAVCLGKRCGKCAEEQKLPVTRQPSDQSTLSVNYENQSLLRCVMVEEPTTEDRRAKLREQENTILQLQSQNQSHPSLVVCQHDRPGLLQPDRQVVLQPDRQVVLQPDRQVVLQPDRQVVLQPDRQVVLQPDQQVVLQPDQQVVLQPDRQVVLQPDRQVVLQPDQQVVLQPDRQVVLQPDQQVVLQHTRPVVLQPDQPGLLQPGFLQHDQPGLLQPGFLQHDQPGILQPGFLQHDQPGVLQPGVLQHDRPGLLQPGFLQHDRPVVLHGVMRQSSVPSHKPPVYRIRRNHSSPDILKFLSSSSGVRASKKKLSSIGRSKSETYEPPLLFPKPQRRHSSVFPSSNNRFKLLSDVTEEPY
ncbi:butyrophilin subfamily 2 member A2-like [Etheostoma cragini]|uniref:butyrophilin subfamily 2 member A2-like n=1 Tax=Etheostoma cragini TaxID=417921 RepID=UPI00155EF8DD|nr:butyrophilin subfamily 2 member A2-like [Etheostoma cragini]